jgi:hypothetical protein
MIILSLTCGQFANYNLHVLSQENTYPVGLQRILAGTQLFMNPTDCLGLCLRCPVPSAYRKCR